MVASAPLGRAAGCAYRATWGSAWLARARHASPQATRPCSSGAFVWAIGSLDEDGSTFSLTVTGTLQRVYNQCGQIKWVNSSNYVWTCNHSVLGGQHEEQVAVGNGFHLDCASHLSRRSLGEDGCLRLSCVLCQGCSMATALQSNLLFIPGAPPD